MSDIAANLETVRQRVKQAALDAGRKADTVQLIAVSKGKSVSDIEAAIAAGQKIFGENRVQEAVEKFTAIRAAHPEIALHLIGPLQTNKAEDAVQISDVIQTLDRPRLAEALANAIRKTGRTPVIYIQVNIGKEIQKSGIAPEALGAFLDFCRAACGLAISGLMCIPPQDKDPQIYFNQMKELAAHYELPHLSMGMSADFESAIRCGTTQVRVGTAVFGAR